MSSASTPLLTVQGLSSGYDKHRPVVQQVSFTLAQCEVLAVLGPNGSGKSTLLRTLAGLLKPSAGSIHWHGAIAHPPGGPHELLRCGISFVPQGGLVLPDLSVREHFSLAVRHRPKADRQAAIEEALSAFPLLEAMGAKRGGMLSGGQRQQLSSALLLAQGTTLWLLDEPTAGLSPALVQDTLAFLQKQQTTRGITMMVVEHDLEVAFCLADRLLVMREGEVIKTLDTQPTGGAIPSLELIYD